MEIRQEEIAMRRLLQITTTIIITQRNTEEAIIITTALIITPEIIQDPATVEAAATQALSQDLQAEAVTQVAALLAVEEDVNI
jgi:hypothetical protein